MCEHPTVDFVFVRDAWPPSPRSTRKPHLLLWSPVCLALSRLQHTKPDELAEQQEQGKHHLEFACGLARLQIEQGGRVLFEYPLAASKEPCLWTLTSTDGMRCVRCDQCQIGMTSDSAGRGGLACKATGFTTNDEYIAEAVNRHCFGGHDHIQSLSGTEKYCDKVPPTVSDSDTACFATEHASRGTRRGMMGRDRQLTIAAVEAGPTLEEP